MSCVRVLALMASIGCHRAPVESPGVPTTPPPKTFDLDAAERAVAQAEASTSALGWVLITGMTEAGATPTGCARNWLDSRDLEPEKRLIVLNTAFKDGMCEMPCPTIVSGAVMGTASAIQPACVPDRFGTPPPADLSASEYLYAVLTVDGVHAALAEDGSPRSTALRGRFDALLPAVPATVGLER